MASLYEEVWFYNNGRFGILRTTACLHKGLLFLALLGPKDCLGIFKGLKDFPSNHIAFFGPLNCVAEVLPANFLILPGLRTRNIEDNMHFLAENLSKLTLFTNKNKGYSGPH